MILPMTNPTKDRLNGSTVGEALTQPLDDPFTKVPTPPSTGLSAGAERTPAPATDPEEAVDKSADRSADDSIRERLSDAHRKTAQEPGSDGSDKNNGARGDIGKGTGAGHAVRSPLTDGIDPTFDTCSCGRKTWAYFSCGCA